MGEQLEGDVPRLPTLLCVSVYQCCVCVCVCACVRACACVRICKCGRHLGRPALVNLPLVLPPRGLQPPPAVRLPAFPHTYANQGGGSDSGVLVCVSVCLPVCLSVCLSVLDTHGHTDTQTQTQTDARTREAAVTGFQSLRVPSQLADANVSLPTRFHEIPCTCLSPQSSHTMPPR